MMLTELRTAVEIVLLQSGGELSFYLALILPSSLFFHSIDFLWSLHSGVDYEQKCHYTACPIPIQVLFPPYCLSSNPLKNGFPEFGKNVVLVTKLEILVI